MTSPDNLQNTLQNIAPTHVAVAYLGSDWRTYLTNLEVLKEIVISPTIGSYPGALSELLDAANKNGFSVYFHPALHAKLFIGDDGCLIGSANLSNNGFGGGLNEAVAYLHDRTSIEQAYGVFDTLKKDAITDPAQQRAMIEELWSKWNRARCHDAMPNEAGERQKGTILDWRPSHERVWLTWLEKDAAPSLNETNVHRAVPEMGHQSPKDYFADFTNLAEDDVIREGDWLIMWTAKKDGTPDLRKTAYWLRVDKLVSQGVKKKGEVYTQLAVTLPSARVVTPPFEVDNDSIIQKLIKELLGQEKHAALRWSESEEIWHFKDVVNQNQRFLRDLQLAYRDKQLAHL